MVTWESAACVAWALALLRVMKTTVSCGMKDLEGFDRLAMILRLFFIFRSLYGTLVIPLPSLAFFPQTSPGCRVGSHILRLLPFCIVPSYQSNP